MHLISLRNREKELREKGEWSMKDLEDKEDLQYVLKIHKVILYTACNKFMTVHFRHMWSIKWSKYYSLDRFHLMRMGLYDTGMVNSFLMD